MWITEHVRCNSISMDVHANRTCLRDPERHWTYVATDSYSQFGFPAHAYIHQTTCNFKMVPIRKHTGGSVHAVPQNTPHDTYGDKRLHSSKVASPNTCGLITCLSSQGLWLHDSMWDVLSGWESRYRLLLCDSHAWWCSIMTCFTEIIGSCVDICYCWLH